MTAGVEVGEAAMQEIAELLARLLREDVPFDLVLDTAAAGVLLFIANETETVADENEAIASIVHAIVQAAMFSKSDPT